MNRKKLVLRTQNIRLLSQAQLRDPVAGVAKTEDTPMALCLTGTAPGWCTGFPKTYSGQLCPPG